MTAPSGRKKSKGCSENWVLGGRGVVLDEEVFDDVEVGSAGVALEAHDVGFAGDAFDLGLGGVDVDVDGVGAGLDGLEVVRFIVGDADEMDAAGVGDGEGETALAVGLAAGALLHALREADEDDVVSGGGFAGGLVGDGAPYCGGGGGLGGGYGGV